MSNNNRNDNSSPTPGAKYRSTLSSTTSTKKAIALSESPLQFVKLWWLNGLSNPRETGCTLLYPWLHRFMAPRTMEHVRSTAERRLRPLRLPSARIMGHVNNTSYDAVLEVSIPFPLTTSHDHPLPSSLSLLFSFFRPALTTAFAMPLTKSFRLRGVAPDMPECW